MPLPLSENTFVITAIVANVAVGMALALAVDKGFPTESFTLRRLRMRLLVAPFGLLGAASAIWGWDAFRDLWWARNSACVQVVPVEDVTEATGADVTVGADQWSDNCSAYYDAPDGARVALVRVQARRDYGSDRDRFADEVSDPGPGFFEIPTKLSGPELRVFRSEHATRALLAAGEGGVIFVQIDRDLPLPAFEALIEKVRGRVAAAAPVLRGAG